MADFFTVTTEDHVATVTFDRPPVNAQNRQTREELIAIFDALSDTPEVRCVILTGANGIFSAGADIKERRGLVAKPGDYISHNRVTRESFYALTDCAKPVIAAINGPAIGAGYAFAACCDILLASTEAYVQMPEVNFGLAGGARFLEMHFPRSLARSMYFTADKVPAEELYRLGIVQAVLPPDELMPHARALAARIAEKSPLAVQKAKAAFNTTDEMPVRDGYRYEQTVTVELSHSPDTREAQAAFVEKRKPNFTGH